MEKRRKVSISGVLCWLIAAVYVAALLKLVVFKYGFTSIFRGLELMPFNDIIEFARGQNGLANVLKNVCGNIAVFVPLGIIIPALKSKPVQSLYGYSDSAALRAVPRFLPTVLAGFCTSLVIEVFQYITGMGITDINDLMLNTLGVAIGYGIYALCCRKVDFKFNNRAGSVMSLLVIGFVCAGALYYFGFGSNLVKTPIYYENKEVLAGLDVQQADQEFIGESITDGQVTGTQPHYDDEGQQTGKTPVAYVIDENTNFYTETHTYDMSPNGNVRSIDIAYAKITPEEYNQRVVKDTELRKLGDEAVAKAEERCYWTKVWLEGDRCTNVMLGVDVSWS